MAKSKKPKHDSKMFYQGELVGKGTNADGQTFSTLLGDCDGNPYEVLDRYMFFSPEVKKALEKSCEMFNKTNRKP